MRDGKLEGVGLTSWTLVHSRRSAICNAAWGNLVSFQIGQKGTNEKHSHSAAMIAFG